MTLMRIEFWNYLLSRLECLKLLSHLSNLNLSFINKKAKARISHWKCLTCWHLLIITNFVFHSSLIETLQAIFNLKEEHEIKKCLVQFRLMSPLPLGSQIKCTRCSNQLSYKEPLVCRNLNQTYELILYPYSFDVAVYSSMVLCQFFFYYFQSTQFLVVIDL